MEKNILPDTNDEKYLEEHEIDAITDADQAIIDEDVTENLSLEKAIETYKKIRTKNDTVTENEQEKIE